MPCYLNLFSYLEELKFICSSLEKNQTEVSAITTELSEFEEEIWTANEDPGEGKLKDWNPQTNWINSCFSSISPFSDVLVLSNSNRTFFLTSKFTKTDENLESQKFLVAADKYLTNENGEEVTCVFCLPVFYQRKSQHSSPDWTCVFVGFSTGVARMYTECGELLFSQQFFDTPIHNIHYEMYNSMEYEGDLLIQNDNKIVAIEGFILIQTLKACRNQLARSKAGQGDLSQPPPMLCKRWSFPEAKNFQSCSFVGHKSLSMFDYLLSETLHGGPSSYPQSSAPVLNSALSTGGDLFLGFHNISDAAGPQALSDVAVAFASKLKTMLTPSIGSKLVSGLWNNNEEKLESQNIASETFTAVPLRFGFFDKTKQGSKIYLSPDRTLAAVTDNQNRVLVVDVNRGLCVKIFKGYRDAQCGWMRSDEADEMDTTKITTLGARRVNYLVIYAPKRGILEVWLAPKGHKVAAFNVNRMGKLFYPGLCVLGLNGLQQQQLRNISNKIGSLIPCCLLEPNGKLTAVITCFKDAMKKPLDSHSYDNSLFDDLQKSVNNFQVDFDDQYFEEIKSNLLKIESYEFLKKAVHLLILSFASKVHCKDIFLQCIECIINAFKLKEEINDDDRRSWLTCLKIVQLSETHKLILKINHEASREAPDQDLKLPPDLQTLATVFSVTEREAADVISSLSMHSEITMNRQSKRKRVSFVEEFDTDSLGFFLDQFKLFDHDQKYRPEDGGGSIPLHFDEHKLDSVFLGQILFDTAIKNSAYSNNIISALDSSGISGLDLIKLLLSHWLSGSVQPQHWKYWINLCQLLKFCFSKISNDDSEVLSPNDNNNKKSDLWKDDVITMLSESSNLEASYIATWLFRALICNDNISKENFSKKLEAGEDSESSNESRADIKEWESLTEESVAWKILGNRLEDLLVLDALLKSKESFQSVKEVTATNVRMNELTYGFCHPVSVSDILQRGQGAVSEVIAEWAVFNDLPPDFFQIDLPTLSSNSDEPDTNEPLYVSDGIKLSPVKGLLREVSKRFPRSCDSDAILANTSCEYIRSWNKKPDKIEKLKYAQQHLNSIKSSSLRNGVACMMWKTICPRFVALAQLIDKVGKTPKDRLCKQDLLMNSNHIEPFLEVCCSFLTYFLEDKIGRTEEEESLTPYPPDDLWRQTTAEKPKNVRTRTYSGGNKPGLVEIASDMDPLHDSTVNYNLSLGRALLFIVTFELKNTRPLSNFFEKESRSLLFGDLNKEIQFISTSPSTAILNARTEFLKRVAVGIVNRIPDILPLNSKTSTLGSMTPNASTPSQSPQLEASKWISLVMTQSKMWGVNSDDIMSHYVCELYSAGHDRLAEEVMGFVVDTRSLASHLLILSGQRLAKIVQTSENTTVKLADLPPRLSSWMNTLNSGFLKNCSSNLEATKTLIGHVVSFIEDEKSTEYKLSLDLFEAVNNLT